MKFSGAESRLAVKVCDLSDRMHPRIRAPCAIEADRLAGDGCQRFFDSGLYGRVSFLDLPSVKAGAVVFDGQFEIFLHDLSNNAIDRGTNESIVDKAMDAEASRVSLSSCDESTYKAVDVGRQKKSMPTLKGSPVT